MHDNCVVVHVKLPGVEVITYDTLADVVTAGHDNVTERLSTNACVLMGISGAPSGVTGVAAGAVDDPNALVVTTAIVYSIPFTTFSIVHEFAVVMQVPPLGLAVAVNDRPD